MNKCPRCNALLEESKSSTTSDGIRQLTRVYECGSRLTIKKLGMNYDPLWNFKCESSPLIPVRTSGER